MKQSQRMMTSVVFTSMLLSMTSSAFGQTRYRIDRPDALLPDANQSWGMGINNDGMVVGTYRADAWKRSKGFVWQDGEIVERILPTDWNDGAEPVSIPLVHRYLRGTAINDAGVVVGDSEHRSFGAGHFGFFTPIPSPTDFPVLYMPTKDFFTGWWCSDVSNTDPMLIVGQGQVWTPGDPLQMHFEGFAQPTTTADGPLDDPGVGLIPSFGDTRRRNKAEGVNDDWIVVGWAEKQNGYARAYAWEYDSERLIDLGTLGGPSSRAFDINNQQIVVGEADLGDNTHHACAWVQRKAQDLGTLGGASSGAKSVNEMGQIVGSSWTAEGTVHAFVYEDERMQDLNDLVDDGGDWILQYAESINDAGQIVGWGFYRGQTHAFVLTPVK